MATPNGTPEHHADDDIVAELTTDHREIEQHFVRLESELAPAERQDVLEQVIAELVRHSIAEEVYLYPSVRDRVPNGAAIADREVAEHADVEVLMKELESKDPHDPQNRATLQQFMALVREHVEEEESMLFPLLRDAYAPAELRELGVKVRTTKAAAPTRPHPSTPHSAAVRAALGPFVGLVDRTRDVLSGRQIH